MSHALEKTKQEQTCPWTLQDRDPFPKAVEANASRLESCKGRTGGKDVEPTPGTSFKEFYCKGVSEKRKQLERIQNQVCFSLFSLKKEILQQACAVLGQFYIRGGGSDDQARRGGIQSPVSGQGEALEVGTREKMIYTVQWHVGSNEGFGTGSPHLMTSNGSVKSETRK